MNGEHAVTLTRFAWDRIAQVLRDRGSALDESLADDLETQLDAEIASRQGSDAPVPAATDGGGGTDRAGTSVEVVEVDFIICPVCEGAGGRLAVNEDDDS